MNFNARKNLLLFSLAAETFLGSYGLLLGGTDHDCFHTLSARIPLFYFRYSFITKAIPASWRDLKNDSYLKWPLFILMLVLAYLTSRYWMDLIPLDPDFADMLPIIKVMNERFLSGSWRHIYDPIPEIWNGTQPIYLPAMWIPYGPAVLMNFDLRWITVTALLLSFSIILFNIKIRMNRYFGYAQIVIAAGLFWWLFAMNDVHGLITMSEEGMVIFYFVLLSLAIISDNALLMGIVTSCCVLSRYSMIGWLAPCVMYYAFQKNYRKLILFSAIGLTCFMVFFLIPFGYKALEQMISLPSSYVGFAKHVWEFTPEVFWLNPGLAKFFGPHRIGILHTTLLVTTFVLPLLFICFCLFQKKWKFENINLACFKFSVVVFYQFIDVPYGYLFYTSSFVSLIIASSLLTTRMEVWKNGSMEV